MKYNRLNHCLGEHMERRTTHHSAVFCQPAPEPVIAEFGWYCIQSKVSSEESAKRNLDRQGFETYLPMMPTDLRKNRARDKELEPLFKGYLFLRLSEQSGDWSPIKNTIGVLKLVRFGEHPARVPDGLIAELKERENSLGLHDVVADYRRGDRVVVRSGGSLEYCQGIFRKSAGARVYILMDILGRETEVCLLRRNIEPAG